MARLTRRTSKRRSRQLEQGTIGTHVSRSASSKQRNSINLRTRSASRKSEINQVIPKTSTRETGSAYARRSRSKGLVFNERKKSFLMRLVLLVLIATALVGIASSVGWFVFKAQVSGKMALHDEGLEQVLSLPEEEGDPFYVLITGRFDDNMREDDGPHFLCLARIDEANRQLTLLSLPHNIEMTMSDMEYHVLSYAEVLGGNAELVTQVENLCGVELSHLVKINAEGFVALVDALGGIDLELAAEVDDPDTGSIYIPAGPSHLGGTEALAVVRCDNYTTPLETRSAVQAQVMEALANKIMAKNFFGRAIAFDAIASNIETTLSFDEVWAMAKSFGTGNGFTLYESMVPGIVSVDPDGTFFSVQRASFDGMLDAIKEGRNPDEAATISGLTPDLVKISVKNGAGIVGGAAQVAEILQARGYQVPETGNADNYVYDETLVVYKSDLYKPTAEDVLSVLGNGRTVEAGLFYKFDTDILVIVGKDFIPTS